MKKKFKTVFYTVREFGNGRWCEQITYTGDTIEQTVVKALNYCRGRKITSFTVLRGLDNKTNIKYNSYIKDI